MGSPLKARRPGSMPVCLEMLGFIWCHAERWGLECGYGWEAIIPGLRSHRWLALPHLSCRFRIITLWGRGGFDPFVRFYILWSQVMRLALVVAFLLSFSTVVEAAPVAVECRVSARSQEGFGTILKQSLQMYLKKNFPATSVNRFKFELVPVVGRTGSKISAADLVPQWGVGANGELTFKRPDINGCTLDFVANIRAVVNGVLYRGSIGPFPISGSYEVMRK